MLNEGQNFQQRAHLSEIQDRLGAPSIQIEHACDGEKLHVTVRAWGRRYRATFGPRQGDATVAYHCGQLRGATLDGERPDLPQMVSASHLRGWGVWVQE